MADVYLGLGSNMGDREAHLRQALAELASLGVVARVSSFYDTAPRDYLDQPRFLNAACLLHTRLTPSDLLLALKRIEGRLGRAPAAVRFGPRVIDLDILLYDGLIINTPALEIPHPRLHERAFVAQPLAEIAPLVRHPLLATSLADLAQALAAQDVRPAPRRAEGVS